MDRTSNILAELGDRSLLAIVPGLSELVLETGKVQLFSAKAQVVQQGRPIESLVIPLDDGLKLVHQPKEGQARDAGYLRKQQSMALGELIRGEPYPYTAMAETITRVLFIPKGEFLELLQKQESVLYYLKLITDSAGLRSFKSFLAERGLDNRNIIKVFRSVEEAPETLLPGQKLDFSVPSLVFLREGKVRVEDGTGSAPSWSVDLGEGAWLGGEAFVAPFRVSYRVTALQKTLFHRARFDKIGVQLNVLKLLEAIYGDPWIVRDRASAAGAAHLPPTPLPGRPLTKTESAAFPPSWSERLQSAHSDGESFSATISNICRLLQVQINLSAVETALALDPRVTPLRVAEILETFGLHTHAIKSNIKDLDKQFFPSIATLGPRLVILLGAHRRKRRVLLHDSVRGLVFMSYTEFAGVWNGLILEVNRIVIDAAEAAPKDSAGKKKKLFDIPKKLSGSSLFNYVWRYRAVMWNILALNFLGIAIHLTTPLLSQKILDEVLSLRDPVTLWTCIAGLILAALLATLIKVAGEYSHSEFAIRFDQELSSCFYRHALSLPVDSYSTQRTGDVLNRINAIVHIRRFLSGSSIDALITLLSIGIYFLVLCNYSVSIACLSVLVLLVVGVGQLFFRRIIVASFEKSFECTGKARSLLGEQIFSMATIKATGSELDMRTRWETAQMDVIGTNRKITLAGNSMQVLLDILAGVTQIAAIWIGATLAIQKSMTPGQVLAVSLYVGQMTGPIGTLSGIMMNFSLFQVSTRRLEELLARRTEQSSDIQVSHSFPLRGKIRLDGVSFRYGEDAPWILKDINLTVYPRQIIAIVGRSGCGKSTLANLIAANLKASSGRIYFDDFDSQFLSLPSLRRQIGFVMQNNELFSGSLAENIAYSYDVVDKDTVHSAAASAGADFVEKLPGKLDYFLGESGVGLSGGEKQRISVARTLHRDPKIIILDEATSALDATTEKVLTENLRDIFREKTAIIIAHRLSTIRNADRILVMEEGQIVEEGGHSELLEKNGHYSRFFQSQMRAPEA